MNNQIRFAMFVLLVNLCLLPTVALVNAQEKAQAEVAKPSPVEILKTAQTIFIRSKSSLFKPATLENSLMQRDEFQQWGIVVTREQSDADLIIEVDRKLFTSSFVYSVLDPKTNRVVASGRVNSIGGTVEGKISDSFIKKLKLIRPFPSAVQPK
jgi:hypothetical protein